MTAAQLTTLRNFVNANAGEFGSVSHDSDGASAIRDALNKAASPAFFVWHTALPVSSIFDSVLWASLTPTDAPDGTQLWANRSLACQGKQFNLQTLLIGSSGVVNASKPNVRQGLQDALTNVASGVGGAATNAGWATLKDGMSRTATRVEKLFAGTGGALDGSTAAKAGTLTFEGELAVADVVSAMGWF